jgi:hypothetical protein
MERFGRNREEAEEDRRYLGERERKIRESEETCAKGGGR